MIEETRALAIEGTLIVRQEIKLIWVIDNNGQKGELHLSILHESMNQDFIRFIKFRLRLIFELTKLDFFFFTLSLS